MEGLEDPDSSQDSSSSEDDDSPGTSGSCTVSSGNRVKMVESTEQCPSSSEDSRSCSSASDAAEILQEERKGAKKDLVEDPPITETAAIEKHETARTTKDRDQVHASDMQEPVSQLQSTVSMMLIMSD